MFSTQTARIFQRLLDNQKKVILTFKMDLFKDTFKFYKRKQEPPDLSAVLDFHEEPLDPMVYRIHLATESWEEYKTADFRELGLNSPETWKVYSVTSHPEGVYFIRNPFTSAGQRKWIRKCLREFPQKPNITNIDKLLSGVDDIWVHHTNIFGQTAIFLLGGTTKDVKPIAVFLRSGDIMVMYGPCRLAYHAVPRIVPATYRPWHIQSSGNSNADDDDWKLFEKYVRHFRINVNVRQVFTS